MNSFKVTMAYTDTYSSSYSDTVLVNDVDLSLSIGEKVVYPNELDFDVRFQ